MREELGISGDTALRLARIFNTTPQFWMNLQARYEVEKARVEAEDDIEAIKPFESEPA